MKNSKLQNGFTLIELLVVVLIIGILASIALPQYTKAVERARASSVIQRLGDLAKAEQLHYMITGEFAGHENLDDMDITFSQLDTDAYTFLIGDREPRNRIQFMARRSGGRFEGGLLFIEVLADGTVTKLCGFNDESVSRRREFCSLVNNTGYLEATFSPLTEDDDNN